MLFFFDPNKIGTEKPRITIARESSAELFWVADCFSSLPRIIFSFFLSFLVRENPIQWVRTTRYPRPLPHGGRPLVGPKKKQVGCLVGKNSLQYCWAGLYLRAGRNKAFVEGLFLSFFHHLHLFSGTVISRLLQLSFFLFFLVLNTQNHWTKWRKKERKVMCVSLH